MDMISGIKRECLIYDRSRVLAEKVEIRIEFEVLVYCIWVYVPINLGVSQSDLTFQETDIILCQQVTKSYLFIVKSPIGTTTWIRSMPYSNGHQGNPALLDWMLVASPEWHGVDEENLKTFAMDVQRYAHRQDDRL